MCNRCAMTQTFDPLRHEGMEDEIFAKVIEGDDAASTLSTSYTLSAGDVFDAEIGTAGDTDWIEVRLVAGRSYEIAMSGEATGDGSLRDPYLRLYDAEGDLVTEDDDGGTDANALIEVTASKTGTYYIAASSFSPFAEGSYTLSFVNTGRGDVAPVGTIDEMAEYLTEGYWVDGGSGMRAFDMSEDNMITVDIAALTGQGRQLARWAFEAWEMVIDVDFVEITNGQADITFDDESLGAFSNSTLLDGEILWSTVNVSQTDWLNRYGTTIDSYSFSTYIHEIGHAIGLGHQGDYNGAARYGVDETFANDSWQLTVMSYFSQVENTYTTASDAEVISAMMVDIVAAQSLYGAAGEGSQTYGDTVWGKGTNLGGYWEDYFEEVSEGLNSSTYDQYAVAFTIYDAEGTDLLDLSFLDTDDRIDMRAEKFSDVDGLIGNVGIARGTILENLITGAGDTEVRGNGAANIIVAGAGNDTIDGGGNDDMIAAGAGVNRIAGGDGEDIFLFDLATDMTGSRITDYRSGTFNLETLEYSGDLLFFENGGFTITYNAQGEMVVNGLRLDGSANRNFAFIKTSQENVIADFEAGDFTENPFGAYSLEIRDTGTEEYFEWQRIFYNEAGAVKKHQMLRDSGELRRTTYDAEETRDWDSQVELLDAEGRLYDKRTYYDNGTDLRLRYDTEESESWETLEETRDASGALTERVFNNDDGSEKRVLYDSNGSKSWATIQELRDSSGALYEERTTYDDDSLTVLRYDIADASWATIEEERDASGQLMERRTTQDNNSEERIRYDIADSEDWATIEENRTASGGLRDRTTTNDDGSETLLRFDVNGVNGWDTIQEDRDVDGLLFRQRNVYDDGSMIRWQYDVEADDAWEVITDSFDTNGDLFKKRIDYDDGGYRVTLYDVADLESWESYARTFDAAGDLVSAVYL